MLSRWEMIGLLLLLLFVVINPGIWKKIIVTWAQDAHTAHSLRCMVGLCELSTAKVILVENCVGQFNELLLCLIRYLDSVTINTGWQFNMYSQVFTMCYICISLNMPYLSRQNAEVSTIRLISVLRNISQWHLILLELKPHRRGKM